MIIHSHICIYAWKLTLLIQRSVEQDLGVMFITLRFWLLSWDPPTPEPPSDAEWISRWCCCLSFLPGLQTYTLYLLLPRASFSRNKPPQSVREEAREGGEQKPRKKRKSKRFRELGRQLGHYITCACLCSHTHPLQERSSHFWTLLSSNC